MRRALVLLGVATGLGGCGSAGPAIDSPPATAPVHAMLPVANCTADRSSVTFADAGLVARTRYPRGPDRRYDFARVSIHNGGAEAHRVRVRRVVVCHAGPVERCGFSDWTPVDRTLAPGETYEVDVDARMPESPPGQAYVVSMIGSVDGRPLCSDVAAWVAVTGPVE